jgi:hypothetical protein
MTTTTDHEQEMLKLIDERDHLEALLDKFAQAVAPTSVIGEHSSGNDPWANALDMLTSAAEVEQLRAQMAEVEKFAAARAEYITAINNCHPDNSADYWRWQGHAEGRRQLSQTLGLSVAWPAQDEENAR